ncbi:hypothetical protein CLOP_g20484 [Closterium sp. NIES-67]|nr:hypothetical protein CLOP_g20484 [Closterium sp. NIES-67]
MVGCFRGGTVRVRWGSGTGLAGEAAAEGVRESEPAAAAEAAAAGAAGAAEAAAVQKRQQQRQQQQQQQQQQQRRHWLGCPWRQELWIAGGGGSRGERRVPRETEESNTGLQGNPRKMPFWLCRGRCTVGIAAGGLRSSTGLGPAASVTVRNQRCSGGGLQGRLLQGWAAVGTAAAEAAAAGAAAAGAAAAGAAAAGAAAAGVAAAGVAAVGVAAVGVAAVGVAARGGGDCTWRLDIKHGIWSSSECDYMEALYRWMQVVGWAFRHMIQNGCELHELRCAAMGRSIGPRDWLATSIVLSIVFLLSPSHPPSPLPSPPPPPTILTPRTPSCFHNQTSTNPTMLARSMLLPGSCPAM